MHSNPLSGHRIGLGSWMLGEHPSNEAAEVAAVTYALEMGYRLIDTAEMYADGGSERVIGGALQSFGRARRQELTIVSKVLPSHASQRGTARVCEEILRRLQCDYLDVLLLHWEGSFTFEETLSAFVKLRERGLIRAWGVSNLDVREFRQWQAAESSLGVGGACATNQVYYSLLARGVEFDLLPDMRTQGMPMMAYTPLGSGELTRHPGLVRLASGLGMTAAQLALAWVIRNPGVIAIPKSADPRRLGENLAATEISLDDKVLADIDRLFPGPRHKMPLAMV